MCATHHLHEGFYENQAATLKWTVLSQLTFAGTIRELQSLLRMEKILSWQAARGWKISRGTEREQVTDTSMDLTLVSSVSVISKSCLDIKTNENIFLPENSSQNTLTHLWKRKLAYHSERYYLTKISILFRAPRTSSHHYYPSAKLYLLSILQGETRNRLTEGVTSQLKGPNF